jgi:16S rRNA processing protein RimM
VLGAVAGAHGTHGELRVRWLGDGPGNLMRAKRIALGREVGDPGSRWYEVERAAPGRDKEIRVSLKGVGTRDGAEALAGLLAMVETADLEPLPPGEHYWVEWIGCTVFASDGRTLGTVRELWDAGAHDVLVVEDHKGRELLLPVAQALLREVDVAARRIVIEVPEGLLPSAE